MKEKKASVKAGDLNPDEVTDFLVGVFGVLSLPMGSHWTIDEDEAEQIAKPLTQILNKMNKKKKDQMNGLMAPMLLITAVAAVIVPRVMITLADWREKREAKRRDLANKAIVQSRANPATIAEPAGRNDQERGTDDENGRDGAQAIPAAIRSGLAGND